MKRILTLAAALLLLVASPSRATLLNPTVVLDTPELWQATVDWTLPAPGDNENLDAGPNWLVNVVEIPLGGGIGLLVTAVHLVAPHTPPPGPGLGLSLQLGPLLPGGAFGPLVDQEGHPDDPGHLDVLTAGILSLNPSTSRLTITLQHGAGSPTPVPEPTTLALLGAGLLAIGRRRWRR